MGKGTPKAPDPYEVAAAQGAENRETALANLETSMFDQKTPWGTLTYEQIGTTENGNPRYQATQNLNKAGQDLVDFSSNQLGRIKSAMNQGINFGSLPERAGVDFVQQGMQNVPEIRNANFLRGEMSGVHDYANDQFVGQHMQGAPDYMHAAHIDQRLANMGAPQGWKTSVGDYAKERSAVEDALMQRLNPQLEQQRAATEAQLAAQGLQPGTEAYNRAMDAHHRGANDARLAVIGQAGNEQARMVNMAMGEMQLHNAARAQAVGEAYQAAGLQNSVRQTQFGEANTLAALRNNARTMALGEATTLASADNAARGQQLNEVYQNANLQNAERAGVLQDQLMERNLPMADYSSLMGGAGMGFGQYAPTPQFSMSPAPIADSIYGTYQAQMQNHQNSMQGIYGLLGAGLGAAGMYFGAGAPALIAGPTVANVAAPKAAAKLGGIY
ncbi:MAG: hypothetical protein ACPGOY_10355 [Rhodospirillaceae bacterium]